MSHDHVRLYVGNIDYRTTANDLVEFFQKAGANVVVAFLSPSKSPDANNGGYAFISAAPGIADQCLAKNGCTGPHGRKSILVRTAINRPQNARPQAAH